MNSYRCAPILFCLLVLIVVRAAAADRGPKVELKGVQDPELVALLKSVSACFGARPAETPEILQQRMDRDRTAMGDALCSRGYFASKVEVVLADLNKPRIIFQVDTGPLFHFLKVEVNLDPASIATAAAAPLPTPKDLGLESGQPARSAPMLSAQTKLDSWLTNHGRPVSNHIERSVLVSLETHSVDVDFRVNPGPVVHVGPTHFQGLQNVDEAFLRSLIPWKVGAVYDPSQMVKYQQALMGKNLFTVVLVNLEKPKGVHANDGDSLTLPIRVEVRERHHRTTKAGVSYHTDSGLGGELEWIHRNIRGVGQQVDVQAVASGVAQAVTAKYIVPQFLRNDQSLLISSRLGRDTPVAYTSENFSTSAVIERAINPKLHASWGLAAKFSDVNQNFIETHVGLLQAPLQLTYDSSDGLLDPTCGQRVALSATPNVDPANTHVNFVNVTLKHRSYHSLTKSKRTVLATRFATGLISASDRSVIPGDERFYSGGGGSVRGYPFQSIGIAQGATVLGGQSFMEGSLEIRQKITPTFGFVGFIDGGTVADTSFGIPQQVLLGAGVGGRYYSPVGPIRLDVAVPLERRIGIDAPFQVYASLGQAF